MAKKAKSPKLTRPNKPNKSNSRAKFHSILVYGGLGLLVAGVLALAIPAVVRHNRNAREQQAQLTRLNAAATDLKSVYDKLVTTLPNIREKNFEKTCVEASTEWGRGTITCGSYDTIISDEYSEDVLTQARQNILKTVSNYSSISQLESLKRNKVYGNLSSNTEYVSRKGVGCFVYDELYDTPQQYTKAKSIAIRQYEGRVYVAYLGCNEISKSFLPGYKVEK